LRLKSKPTCNIPDPPSLLFNGRQDQPGAPRNVNPGSVLRHVVSPAARVLPRAPDQTLSMRRADHLLAGYKPPRGPEGAPPSFITFETSHDFDTRYPAWRCCCRTPGVTIARSERRVVIHDGRLLLDA
jgi:hypothetical protein